MGPGLGRGDTKKAVGRMQEMLATIGYDLSPSGVFDEQTEAVVRAFQRRWVQNRVTGHADTTTLQRIGLLNLTYQVAAEEQAGG